VLRTDLRNHRRSTEPELLEALARREPLALAEACSRTLAVGYAVGRRLLTASDIEALLLELYTSMWESPPTDVPLERWVRTRCCELALAELREQGTAPAAPSAHVLAPDLPEPSTTYLDTTERALASLSEAERLAVLRAHDGGVPSSEQGEGAGPRLVRSLRVLADPASEDTTSDDIDPDGRLADWVLGLLPLEEAAALEQEVVGDPLRSAALQVLRRGRRRIEGLPPTPDLGPRLLAAVLSGVPATPVEPPVSAAPAAVEADHAPDEADPGWGATESGPTEGADPSPQSFDDTPPEGYPAAAPSALDEQRESSTDADFRLSDLFDDSEVDPIGSVFDEETEQEPAWARPEPAAAPEPEVATTLPDDAGPQGTAEWGADDDGRTVPDGAAAWDESDGELLTSHADSDTELPERQRPSAAVRLLQVLGVLLLLAAGVGLGLFLGQILLSLLRG
jgi:DNA-directed RNA polymerase specialized sigma24 family protein